MALTFIRLFRHNMRRKCVACLVAAKSRLKKGPFEHGRSRNVGNCKRRVIYSVLFIISQGIKKSQKVFSPSRSK